MQNFGLFITFESVDGLGKTTQVKLLTENLQSLGYCVIFTREPGGPRISEKIRQILLDPENKEMHNNTEILLYLASRAQHVEETIKPALAQGKIVICDRFQDSTFAYQSSARGVDFTTIKNLNNFATGGLNPDLTFVLHAPLEVAHERLKKTGKQPDRLENENSEFYSKVSDGFLALAKYTGQKLSRFRIINAEQTLEQVSKEILSKTLEKLTFINDLKKSTGSN